jgi:hypothetical protein
VVIFPCTPEARRSSTQLNASGYEHRANVRRAAVRKIRDRGVARGELDPNLDPEVALED